MQNSNHHKHISKTEIIEPESFGEILDLDHPGSHDIEYRKRREAIAKLAKEYRKNPEMEIPEVDYTKNEETMWKEVNEVLSDLHDKHASSTYIQARKKLDMPIGHIPQLREVSKKINTFENFKLAPIEGLVDARTFLSQLEKGIMMCTQYIRHTSRPTFTPEPDIIHELLGHAPMFVNKEIVEFSKFIGRGARCANKEQLEQLGRLYWYTLEYGMIEENGEAKAFGAGLLGGIEDLNNATKDNADVRPFDLEEIINTDFNYSFLQKRYFVVPSFEILKKETEKFIEKIT